MNRSDVLGEKSTNVSPLQLVDLAPGKLAEAIGLVPVHNGRRRTSLAEEAAVREAALFERIDFIFFRRFADARSPQIAAYIVDNTNGKLSNEALADLHWHVWMQGAAPLLYVAWPARLDVLACARAPDFWQKDRQMRKYPDPAELPLTVAINTATEVASAMDHARPYSAHRLADGTFWEDPNNALLVDVQEASHHQLIKAIVETDQELDGANRPLVRRLLLLTLLVKYLEDRSVFPGPSWFGRFCAGARSFHDLLRNGSVKEVSAFFLFLENRFNGDVFSFPAKGIEALDAQTLRDFADLVEARTLKRQRYLWDQYSFKHLPVEVLSHLYQRFAQRECGAIFTPPFVAALLLDYALPYKGMTGKERVLDPTCGSGIFLVGAFRRLVHYWRSRHGWRQPSVLFLKRLLSEQIHGVELQAEALDLAAFNLALALCDALRPDIIWRDLRFDRLGGSSLHTADFFDYATESPGNFDLIIGNPPFKSALTSAAKRFDESLEGERIHVPDKQIAYLIAERAIPLLSDIGRICLLEPSGLIFNEKPIPYFRRFLTAHRTDFILDFTSIRNLFDEADTKVIALIAAKAEPRNHEHQIEHHTFRRTQIVDQRLGFELDHYDRHVVPLGRALAVPETWKIDLLGGGRLHFLAERLAEMGTLREFIEGKGWDFGEGFIRGNQKTEALWLKDKPFLPSVALGADGIDLSKLGRVESDHFEGPRNPERYTGPLFLIRENERLQCAYWGQGFLAYGAQIVGIGSQEPALLKQFADDFLSHRRELTAFCLIRGTRAFASKATAINKTDIDRLPWPQKGEPWELSETETLLCADLVDHIAEFVRTGQNSRLLKTSADDLDYSTYAATFVKTLAPIHRGLRAGKAYSFDGLACQVFYFGPSPIIKWSDDWSESLRKLVYAPQSAALRTARVLRFYQSNVILIVKPDRLRYWIKSVAVWDADETLHDLQRQGY